MSRTPDSPAPATARPAAAAHAGNDRHGRRCSAWARPLWTGAGALFLALGALGIPLPLLPTTPLLLLAAACFMQGSPRMYKWMMTNRFFGAYLSDYRAGHGIPLGTKALAISLLWTGIGAAILGLVRSTWLQLLLAVVAIAVTVHILLIRTKRT